LLKYKNIVFGLGEINEETAKRPTKRKALGKRAIRQLTRKTKRGKK
jgi:hypothetical protein